MSVKEVPKPKVDTRYFGLPKESRNESQREHSDENPRYRFEILPAFIELERDVQEEIPKEYRPYQLTKGMDDKHISQTDHKPVFNNQR
jgi:hypothetical protein